MTASDAPFLEETRAGCRITPRLLRTGWGEPLAQHVTMRLADSRVIAPTAAARRFSVSPPVGRDVLATVEVRPELIAEAAAAALALPDLRGRSPLCCAARRAAARVGVVERLRSADVADALELTRRRVDQILAEQAEPSFPSELIRATRIQLRFRSALAATHG